MKWTPWFYWNMMGILLNKVATCKIERRGDEICPGAYAIKITISKAFLYGLLIIKGKWTSFNDLSYLLVIINDKVMKKCRIILLLWFFHWIYLNQLRYNRIEGLVNTSNHMVYMSICWWIFSPDFFLKYEFLLNAPTRSNFMHILESCHLVRFGNRMDFWRYLTQYYSSS